MRSIDLNFLSRRDKDLPLPELVFLDFDYYAGCYFRPEPMEYFWENQFLDLRNGLIAVSTRCGGIAGILAHEWRHHWQVFHGFKLDSIGWNSPTDYDSAIREYFTKSKSEADALRFQVKTVGWEKDDRWKKILEGRFDFAN